MASAQYVLLLSKSRKSEHLFFLNSNLLLQMTLRKVFKGEYTLYKEPRVKGRGCYCWTREQRDRESLKLECMCA